MSEPQQPPVPPDTQNNPADQQYAPQHHSAQQYQTQPQHPAQPHYPAQPQYPAQPPHPGQPPHLAQQTAAPGGSLGRIAFIIALVALTIGILVNFSFPLIIRSLSSSPAIGVFSAVESTLVLAVSVVALILGIISVRRPGPRILAGIAIGISASAIAGILVSWLSNLALALMYS